MLSLLIFVLKRNPARLNMEKSHRRYRSILKLCIILCSIHRVSNLRLLIYTSLIKINLVRFEIYILNIPFNKNLLV